MLPKNFESLVLRVNFVATYTVGLTQGFQVKGEKVQKGKN